MKVDWDGDGMRSKIRAIGKWDVDGERDGEAMRNLLNLAKLGNPIEKRKLI